MLKSGSSWNLVPLPASSTKGGWEGCAESSGIRLGRGTTIWLFGPASKPTTSWLGHFQKHSWCVGTSHGQHGLTWLTMTWTRGKPPPSPIYYSLHCFSAPASKWLLFPGLPRRSPKTVSVWTLGTLGAHNSQLKPWIGMRSEANLYLLKSFPTVCRTPPANTGIGSILDFLWSGVKLVVWLPTLLSTINCAIDVRMAHVRPFSTSTLRGLSKNIKNISRQGVLTSTIEL